MTFLQNTWYCSSWQHEITRKPLMRTILDTPVVLYRKEDGSAVALHDTCPHRFAPLHLGELRGDAIECPYHGLQFGETGACILNPHGGPIPPALKVKAFPLVERHQVAWIWMGDPEKADPDTIPDCRHLDDPAFKSLFIYMPINGSYELVNDNLLDLSHTRFLHKVFQAPTADSYEYDIIQEDRKVISIYNTLDAEKAAMLEMMWPDGPSHVDIYNEILWNAPSSFVHTNKNTGHGAAKDAGITGITAHLITPETEITSHYFLGYARNWRQDDLAFEEMLRVGLYTAVHDDDEMMIAQVQRRMGPTGDLMSLRPVILSTDSAAVRARRILAKLIREENAGSDDWKESGKELTGSAAA